jgi:NhaP-type Na+/H+ or K+/H+ antiporter
MLSMMFLIGLLGIYSLLKTRLQMFEQYSIYLVVFALIILFTSAYKKQTKYIKNRIATIIKKNSKIIT